LGFLAITVCGYGKTSETVVNASDLVTIRGIKPVTADPPRDESPTAQQYIERGLPAPDRTWSAEDLAQAAKVLGSFKAAEYANLPRYESPKSGAGFSRMVARENIDAFMKQGFRLSSRLAQSIGY
jgi:hypothetical protein